MPTQNQYKSLQQYVAEQSAVSPTFAEELARAREGTRLGLALTEMRETRGLTRRELSEKTGIKQPMLARIERGQMPTLPTLGCIAQALSARVVILSGEGVLIEAVETEVVSSVRHRPKETSLAMS